MSENQATNQPTNGFWSKFGKWIMFALAGLATLLTLGALARKNASTSPIESDVQKKLDSLDKETISDVVNEANATHDNIEAAQQKAVDMSTSGNSSVDKVKADFDAAQTADGKIAQFNAGMKKRRE